MMKRRSLLAAPLLLGLAPAKPEISIGPSDSSQREASLWLPSGAVFTFPADRARLLAVLHLKVMDVAVVAFAADPPGATQDVAALVGADGQLLALERWSWRAGSKPEDGELVTHLALLGDHVHITLTREVSRKDARWRRESWIDYLHFNQGLLVDAPQRKPLAGTFQEFVCQQRADIAEQLIPGTRTVPKDLLDDMKTSVLPERLLGDAGEKT